MSGWTLHLRNPPPLRVDLRGITPAALVGADVAHLKVPHGNGTLALGELFDITPRTSDDALVLDGDCSRFDRIGWQMDGGTLIVEGAACHYAGALMRSGRVHVRGNAGELAACEMAGGTLAIDGDAGDFAAATLPGSMDGMRGGTLIVHGQVGARCADRMRRGSVVVFGDAGDFMASRLVAGTIALGGRCGAHPGWGMRRGSLVFAGAAAPVPPAHTFVEAIDDAAVAWQLLARDLAQHGGVFADLPSRRTRRWRGDLAAEGKGEWITCA
jgi:formylmethanofuran dehydrogenase subunit C